MTKDDHVVGDISSSWNATLYYDPTLANFTISSGLEIITASCVEPIHASQAFLLYLVRPDDVYKVQELWLFRVLSGVACQWLSWNVPLRSHTVSCRTSLFFAWVKSGVSITNVRFYKEHLENKSTN